MSGPAELTTFEYQLIPETDRRVPVGELMETLREMLPGAAVTNWAYQSHRGGGIPARDLFGNPISYVLNVTVEAPEGLTREGVRMRIVEALMRLESSHVDVVNA